MYAEGPYLFSMETDLLRPWLLQREQHWSTKGTNTFTLTKWLVCPDYPFIFLPSGNNELDHFRNYQSALEMFILNNKYSFCEETISLQEHELFFKKADINSLKSVFTNHSYVLPLLCLYSVFEAPEHKKKKRMVQSILTPVMNGLPYYKLCDIYSKYIDYICLSKSKVMLRELYMMDFNQSLELEVKLCISKKLLQYGQIETHEEFLHKHWRCFFIQDKNATFDLDKTETRSMLVEVLLLTFKHFDENYFLFNFPMVLSLICVLSMFDAPEHEEKKKMVQSILTPVLNGLPDEELYDIYSEYNDHILKSKVTLFELDFIKYNPSLATKLKLCVHRYLLHHGLHKEHEEFLQTHWKDILAKVEDVIFDLKRTDTRSRFWEVLLHSLLLFFKKPHENVKNISELYKKLSIFFNSLSDMESDKNLEMIGRIFKGENLNIFLKGFSAVYNPCIFSHCIENVLLTKPKVSSSELDIRMYKPSLEMKLKLCESEILLQHGLHQAHEEFLHKHWRYFIKKFENAIYEKPKTRCSYLNVLLHILLLFLKSSPENSKNISELYKKLSMVYNSLKYNDTIDQIFDIFLNKFSAFNNPCIFGMNESDEPNPTCKFSSLLKIIQMFQKEKLGNCLERLCEIEDYSPFEESLIVHRVYKVSREKYCRYNDSISLALLILDINKSYLKTSLMNTLTEKLWSLLKINLSINTRNILFSCLEIIREAVKNPQEKENEIVKKARVSELLTLLMLLLLMTSIGHHKSAKLKKYLTLKYEYDGAILYLLWCSGDVERNPGPPFKKRQLCHTSKRERKWMHDMSAVLLKCYHEVDPNAKQKKIWSRKPDHWPSSKPFYDTKNRSQDESGQVISDEDLLKCLLECCQKKGMYIQHSYQKEINAQQSNKIQLLYKLYVLRTEAETLYEILQYLHQYIEANELKQNLMVIKVALNTEIGIKGKTKRFVDITRDLAGVLCRVVKGKDPEEKCDGIWNEAPEEWPKDVTFFNPNNRGKSKMKKCSDQKLVETFLQLPKAKVDQKYKSWVDAYIYAMKAGCKKESKKLKEICCKLYVKETYISKLDDVLENLKKEGLFLSEVNNIIDQWWSSETVDNDAEEKLSQTKCNSEERPDISINISPNSIRISTNPANKSQVISYCIPINHSNSPSGATSGQTFKQGYIHIEVDETSHHTSTSEDLRNHSLLTSSDHIGQERSSQQIFLPGDSSLLVKDFYDCQLGQTCDLNDPSGNSRRGISTSAIYKSELTDCTTIQSNNIDRTSSTSRILVERKSGSATTLFKRQSKASTSKSIQLNRKDADSRKDIQIPKLILRKKPAINFNTDNQQLQIYHSQWTIQPDYGLQKDGQDIPNASNEILSCTQEKQNDNAINYENQPDSCEIDVQAKHSQPSSLPQSKTRKRKQKTCNASKDSVKSLTKKLKNTNQQDFTTNVQTTKVVEKDLTAPNDHIDEPELNVMYTQNDHLHEPSNCALSTDSLSDHCDANNIHVSVGIPQVEQSENNKMTEQLQLENLLDENLLTDNFSLENLLTDNFSPENLLTDTFCLDDIFNYECGKESQIEKILNDSS